MFEEPGKTPAQRRERLRRLRKEFLDLCIGTLKISADSNPPWMILYAVLLLWGSSGAACSPN
jgi:hypothetical protein